MATTMVGIFDDFAQAQKAVQELKQMGVRQGDVSIVRNDGGKGYTTYGGANSTDYTTGTSIGGKITNFFDGIFGTDMNDDDGGGYHDYAEAVRRGSTVVVVEADDASHDRVADILNRSGVVDANQRTAQYRSSGYQKFDSSAPLYNNEQSERERSTYANQGEVALPVIEEQLNVGKRVVQRGGVRVHTSVRERPVEETVTLREENVTVDRRPVDRAVTDADLRAAKEGEFKVTTRAEEAVVGKEARIVEEVVIGKNTTEREETVRDTVKRTDVQVEETTDRNVDNRNSNKARS